MAVMVAATGRWWAVSGERVTSGDSRGRCGGAVPALSEAGGIKEALAALQKHCSGICRKDQNPCPNPSVWNQCGWLTQIAPQLHVQWLTGCFCPQ